MSDPAPIPYPRLGEYVLLREVGRGGMGIVYEALQESLHRRAAVKVLPPSSTLEPEHVKRFQREAEAAAKLTHPNLVTVYGVGQDQGVYYIAMEFLEGESLDKRIKRAGDGLPFEEVIDVGLQVASGLSAAHAAGVLHRDIKPSNLMVVSSSEPARPSGLVSSTDDTVQLATARRSDATTGTGLRSSLRVKVTDFGLAKSMDSATMTASGTVLGTPMYMPPEQVRGEELDGRADVYSLGMVLYEAASGFPPFLTSNAHETLKKVTDEEPVRPRKRRPAIPRDLETVILKAIEKDRGRRYASATELEEDLRRLRAGDPVLAKAAGPIGRLARRAAKHPVFSAVVLGAFVVGLFGAFGFWKGGKAKREVEADALIEEAARLRAEGHATEAVADLRRATQLAPTSGRAWRALGEALLADKQDADARDALDRAARLLPRDADAWRGLALARGRCGDWGGAFRAADESVRLAPESPDPLRARAELRQQHGDPEEALADLQRAKDVEGAAWKRKLGEVDRLLEAKEALKAIQQLASFPPSERATGGWLLRRGLALQALSATANASLLATLDGIGMQVRTEGLKPGAALLARAQEDCEKAAAADASDPRLHVALARVAEARGDRETALAEWNKALESSPEDPEALRARAALELDSQDWKGARADLDRLLRAAPSDPALRFDRGCTFLFAGCEESLLRSKIPAMRIGALFDPSHVINAGPDAEQSLEDLEAAIRGGHEVRNGHLYRSVILSGLGRTAEALAELAPFLQSRPDDAEIAFAKGLVLVRAKDFVGAKEIAAGFLKKDPDDLSGWFLRGVSASEAKDAKGEAEASTHLVRFAMTHPEMAEWLVPTKQPRPSPQAGRFGITLADMGNGYARFDRGDLGRFVQALGSDDARSRDMAETVLWKAGPGAIAPLEAAAKAGGGGARVAEVAKAIRQAVEQEEVAVAAALLDRHNASPLAFDFETVAGVRRDTRTGGRCLARALARMARSAAGPHETPALGLAMAAAEEDSMECLLPLLQDADPKVVTMALDVVPSALEWEGVEVPAELIALTRSSDSAIRAKAIDCLAPRLGLRLEEDARRGLREDPEHLWLYARALATMGSRDGAFEAATAVEGDSRAVSAAIVLPLLRRCGDARVTAIVRRMASDPARPGRMSALEVLGWCGGEEDVPALIEDLGSDKPEVRITAMRALGRIGSSRAIEPLRAMMGKDDPPPARPLGITPVPASSFAAWALATLGCVDGVGKLCTLVTEARSPLGLMGLEGQLAELGLPGVADTWLASLRGPRAPTRSLQFEFLDQVAYLEQAPALIEALRSATGDQEATRYAIALARLGDPNAVPAIEALLAKVSDPDTRIEVAWALSRCGKVVPCPEARKAMLHRNGRLQAAELLARNGDAEALDLLRRVLRGELRMEGLHISIFALAQVAQSPRFQAAEALALCGDHDAWLALAAYLDSRDILERRRAWAMLRRVTGKEVAYQPLALRADLEKGRKAWEDALK